MNEEYIRKVIQILENTQSELRACGKCRFSDETRRLISEVAEYCRKTKIYNHVKDKPEYIRTESAEYLYNHMLTKIAKAPFPSLGTIVAIIMMPAIDDAIKGGRVDDN